jgi:hypothetical protein
MRHQSLKLVAATALVLAAAACGGSSGAGTSGGSPDLTITSPADGDTVRTPFALTWDSSEPLGPPDSGKDHVHVYVDGKSNDYTVVGGTRFQVKGLAPGKHQVQISLQHADHSSAGAEDSVEVTVSGGGGGSPSPSSSDDGGRYGY